MIFWKKRSYKKTFKYSHKKIKMEYHTSRVTVVCLQEQAKLSKDKRKNRVPVKKKWSIRHITPLRREIWNERKENGNEEISREERKRIAQIYT
jgi:hypothetical protein